MAGQNAAMERLVQLLYLLTHSRGGGAVPAEDLLRVLAYGAAGLDGRRRQLARDIEQLRAAGWDVRNESAPGEEAHYRLVAADLRIRVQFAPDEQAELQRVARIARREDGDDFVPAADAVTPPAALDLVFHAVQEQCLLEFTYRGAARVAHPVAVHPRPGTWYLLARQDGHDRNKLFRVDRMTEVAVSQPGTADPGDRAARVSMDPIAWREDPMVVAVVGTTREHVPHVVDLLGAPEAGAQAGPGNRHADAAGDPVVLRIPVTHRAAFRARLYELGTRVRLIGPQDLRDEVRADLLGVIGGVR